MKSRLIAELNVILRSYFHRYDFVPKTNIKSKINSLITVLSELVKFNTESSVWWSSVNVKIFVIISRKGTQNIYKIKKPVSCLWIGVFACVHTQAQTSGKTLRHDILYFLLFTFNGMFWAIFLTNNCFRFIYLTEYYKRINFYLRVFVP